MTKLVAVSSPEDPQATPGNGFPTREQVKSAHWRGACPESDMDFDDIYNRGFEAWLQWELDSARIDELEGHERLRKAWRERNTRLKEKLEEVREILSVRRVAEAGGNWDESTRALENEYTLHAIEEIVFLDNQDGVKK